MGGEIELIVPLANYLLPIMKQMRIDDIPQKDKNVELKHADWNKQYEARINRCLGIDILWV